jgi:hypothetical protein
MNGRQFPPISFYPFVDIDYMIFIFNCGAIFQIIKYRVDVIVIAIREHSSRPIILEPHRHRNVIGRFVYISRFEKFIVPGVDPMHRCKKPLIIVWERIELHFLHMVPVLAPSLDRAFHDHLTTSS